MDTPTTNRGLTIPLLFKEKACEKPHFKGAGKCEGVPKGKCEGLPQSVPPQSLMDAPTRNRGITIPLLFKEKACEKPHFKGAGWCEGVPNGKCEGLPAASAKGFQQIFTL
ncbi:MAG: hypothetical protein AAF587_42705 [Bacteroidota bacterium]